MGFFKNLGDELGTGAGKGFNAFITVCWKIFCAFCSWLFKWQHKSNEHELHTNSLRIAIGSLILAFIFIPGLVTCSFSPKDLVNNKIVSPGGVYIKPNISIRSPSFFPKNESFEIDYEQDVQHYREFDGMRLFSYHHRNNRSFPVIHIESDSCTVVPAGKMIGFQTNRPPVYAANMKDIVYYAEKIEYINFFKRNTVFLYALVDELKNFTRTSNSWKYVTTHWIEVDTSRYNIVAEALDKKDIPDNVAGGLVCF